MTRPLFSGPQDGESDSILSPTLLINERVQHLWDQGKTVFHLGFGESRMPIPEKLKTALQNHAHQKSYLSSQGYPELREAIAQFYRLNFGVPALPEQVMVGPGSKALIFAIQLALDSELILPTPSWVSYAPQAKLLGKPIHYLEGNFANHYRWTIESLNQVLAKRTARPKVLIINSPNNPTGMQYDANFLREVADFCRANRIVVLSDEIYGLVAYQPGSHVSISQFYPEGTIVLGGLSKHLSLGGWRLGTAIFPGTIEGNNLLRRACGIASELWSSVAAPIQHAAIVAHSNDLEIRDYIRQCTRLHAVRSRYMWSRLTELGIHCTPPAGGFYMVANFDRWRESLAKKGIQTSIDLANYLLEWYQLATLPGTEFGIRENELSLRLATSYLDMESDAQALAMMDAFETVTDVDVLTRDYFPVMNCALDQFAKFVNRELGTTA